MSTFGNSKKVIWKGRQVTLGQGRAVHLCICYLVWSAQQPCEKDHCSERLNCLPKVTVSGTSRVWSQCRLAPDLLSCISCHSISNSLTLLYSSLFSLTTQTESVWKLEFLTLDFERTFLAQTYTWIPSISSLAPSFPCVWTEAKLDRDVHDPGPKETLTLF
jgi:hypothetical protein